MRGVDVCVPVHDPDPAYLHALLDSLTRQTFSDFTVQISDDSQVPVAEALVEPYRGRLAITVHREPAGQGMVHNWNAVVRMGSAEAALLLGQDDFLTDDALGSLVEALDREPGLVAVSSARVVVDETGGPSSFRPRVNDRSYVFRHREWYRLDRHELARLILRNGNPIGEPSAVLFRRDAFDAVGGWDPRYRQVVDADFYIRIAEHGDVGYLNRQLLRYRWHGQSQTTHNVRTGISSLERVRMIEQYAGPAGLTKDELNDCVATAVLHCTFDLLRGVRAGSGAAVRVNLRLLLRLCRFWPRPLKVLAAVREALRRKNLDER